MSSTTIKISAGYETVNPIFHLKRISQREEREFFASVGDLANHDNPEAKDAHEYECLVEALKKWSVHRLTKGEGDGSALYFDDSEADSKTDAGADIDRYLIEADARGDDVQRLVKDLLNQYLIRLQPSVVFW
jgi:hypothetical protein